MCVAAFCIAVYVVRYIRCPHLAAVRVVISAAVCITCRTHRARVASAHVISATARAVHSISRARVAVSAAVQMVASIVSSRDTLSGCSWLEDVVGGHAGNGPIRTVAGRWVQLGAGAGNGWGEIPGRLGVFLCRV